MAHPDRLRPTPPGVHPPYLYPDYRSTPARAPSQPLIAILRLVRSLPAGMSVIVHHDRDPALLYPELAELGWGAERIDGAAGEVRLRLARGRLMALAAIPSWATRAAACCRRRSRFASSARRWPFTCWPGWRCLAGGHAVPGFAGGLGLPLAALHLVTLGVLAMTAHRGQLLQLLPVATRQPGGSARTLAALVVGLHARRCAAHGSDGVRTAAAAGRRCGSRRARARRLCAAARAQPAGRQRHGGGRRARLGRTGLPAGPAAQRPVARRGLPRPRHLRSLPTRSACMWPLPPYGFMGLLVLGLSYILVPMFALSQRPAAPRARWPPAALLGGGLVLGARRRSTRRRRCCAPLAYRRRPAACCCTSC